MADSPPKSVEIVEFPLIHNVRGRGASGRDETDLPAGFNHADVARRPAGSLGQIDQRPALLDLATQRGEREELIGATSGSEKPATTEEPGRDWGMPLVSSGEKAPTVRPEDEQNIPDKLIQEGLEEADRDQRSRSGQSGET